MLRTFLRSWPAVLRWKNGLWSSAILASESEAEHSEKKIITRNSKLIEQITQQPLNHHWIIITVEKHSVVRKIFSAGSISSAWLCVSVLSWQRWESDPAKSNPSILASWPAIQLEPKKKWRRRFVSVYILCVCVCVGSFFLKCSKFCCLFRFILFSVLFLYVWFLWGIFLFGVFFSWISARPWHESFGLPRQIWKRWQEPRPKCRKSRFVTSIGATLETNKNNLGNTGVV